MNCVPRGSMCAHCAKSRLRDCKDLPFERMLFSKKYARHTVAVVSTETNNYQGPQLEEPPMRGDLPGLRRGW